MKRHGELFDGAAEIFRRHSTFRSWWESPVNVLDAIVGPVKGNHVVNVTRRVCDKMMFNRLSIYGISVRCNSQS